MLVAVGLIAGDLLKSGVWMLLALLSRGEMRAL
jgi:hypothetical protein